MGFGNGAFQAARIAIDGATVIENIFTGKIQTGPNIGIGTIAIDGSTLALPIINNQDIDTSVPFQQMVQLNLSQYSQLKGIASDLSNIYFSSDQQGQNKLYSWRETPASLTSTQTWWVLLPNNIPANGTITIYLQVSSSTELDGVYTGEAPQLSSTYAQYDNGANVFTNYWNFAGTSLPASFTSGVSSDGTLTVNNGLTLGTSATDNPSYAYIVSTSTYAPQIVEFYLSGIPTGPNGVGGISTDWGFSSSTSPTPQGGGTDNNFKYLIGSAIYSSGGNYTYELWDNNTEETSGGGALNTGIYGTYINPLSLYYNYAVGLSATTTITSSNYLLLGISSAGSSAAFHSAETIQVNWLRTRAYPPNGNMPVLQASITKVTQAVIISSTNTWTAPQIFSEGLADVNPTYTYVTNKYDNNVSVINTSTNTVVDTFSVELIPDGIAITPNGLYAYVANGASSSVSVINTSTNTIVSTITVGTSPYGVAITPNGLYAYVANVGSNNVSVINTSTNTVVDTIPVGTYPADAAITPNGLYAYVANVGSNNVSVINTSTNTVVDTIPVGTYPDGVAITPNGLYAYVVNYGSNNVSVINTSTNTIVSTITVGTNPYGVAITPNGLYAYVVNYGSNNVSVINTSTNTVVDTIPVGTNPVDAAITPNGLYAYVANVSSNNVSVINTSTNTVVDTITVGTSPFGVAITPYFYTSTQIAPHLSGFQQNTATPQTTLAGSTAGSITYSMPTAEGAYKKFVAYASGYENDTTTAQTISFPVAFTNTPYIVTAPSGLISSTTTTSITLASGTTTTYTGWVIIEGY